MNKRVPAIAGPSIPVPPDLYGGTKRIIAMVNEGLVERGYRVDMMSLSKSDCVCSRIPFRLKWRTLNQMTKPNKHINLPCHAFYRYDDAFKKKILDDITQGLISERKSAQLYNIDRKSIFACRIAMGRCVLRKLETP